MEGNKLKEARNRAGLSQAELANRSEVSARMIQHYEQGVKDINKAQGITLYKLAQALQVTIEDLLQLEDLKKA